MLQTDFIIGQDCFADLVVSPTSHENFYYLFNQSLNRLIKRFVLDERPRVGYFCEVTLIKKGEKFTPRLHFIVRDTTGKLAKVRAVKNEETIHLKASVNLNECYERFWQLISFLRSLSEIEIPDESFSLVSKEEGEIVAAIRKRDTGSIKNIIRQLSTTESISLSEEDLNELLKRRDRLGALSAGLKQQKTERWWQQFFNDNKWIFGYGLNYVILRLEESQPNVGGTQTNRRGGQLPDYLASTSGKVRFTVLVEIKTPDTPLLCGTEEIRSGAWSLSQQLTDALAQTQANVDGWNERGSKLQENMDRFESQDIFTVKPKGIIVIGLLNEVWGNRHKLQTFERFRKSVHGVEIITFDELHERARFIVEHKA
jgi:Shedu protein SduA, C-terminal